MSTRAFASASKSPTIPLASFTAGTLWRALRLDSMSFIVVLVVVGVLAFCLFGKPHALFVIRIQNGAPIATRGKVTEAFLSTIAEICDEEEIQAGEIRGVPRGRR